MPLKKIVIRKDSSGMKVIDFLRREMPDLPESILRRLFASRDVKLDGIRVSRDELLREG